MKLSNISIIFIIIVLPVILLLSYYVSLQIDTINMQSAYTTKHVEATKEAIKSFEINTVEWNEAYSKKSDSKRRDVMASINTFTTSFANSVGVGGTNKENILTYIPAIAVTLHDGYYIYTPSETKQVIKDENGVAVFLDEEIVKSEPSPITGYDYDIADEGKLLYEYDSTKGGSSYGTYNGIEFTLDENFAKSTYEHILKPYATYSARYKNEDIDITVNYTLDNYITVYGTVDGEYVVKSGYLVDTSVNLDETEILTERIAWKDNDSDEEYTSGVYQYIYSENNTKVYFDHTQGDKTFFVNSNGIRTNLEELTNTNYKKLLVQKEDDYYPVYQALADCDLDRDGTPDIIAGKWYKTKGVAQSEINIAIPIKSDVSAKNYYVQSITFSNWVKNKLGSIKIEHMQNVEEQAIYGDLNTQIFNFSDPEDEESAINIHKREVIKQTLISNLNQAITSYSRKTIEGEYVLPILSETDWDHVLRNVSIITFLQNIPIGLKYYNNYAIATSTANKDFVNPDEIYISNEEDNYYHLPYCSKLQGDSPQIGYRNIDYVLKSYEDSDGTKYYYKHSSNVSNNEACYYCLVQRELYDPLDSSSAEYDEQDKTYKVALARERYNYFKQEEQEDLYLYNYGNEYANITGGWYPSIMDTWSNTAEQHRGALYEKTDSYLRVGDSEESAYGCGGFTTGAKIEEIADYDYLCIKFKVTEYYQRGGNPLGFNIYLCSTPAFVEYMDYNDYYNGRDMYKFKQVDQNQEYKDVAYETKTKDELRQIVLEKAVSGYSSTMYNKIWAKRIWSGDTGRINDVDNVIEVRIELSENDKRVIKQRNGCHISLSGYAWEGNVYSKIGIEVYQVYLTSEGPDGNYEFVTRPELGDGI